MSATHRALHISETLDLIFSFNEQRDAARCSRVCKTWKAVALDHVWHTVHGVLPLFSLLAPFSWQSNGRKRDLVFSRKLRPSDWAHFSPFARRVKSLRLSSVSNYVHESAFIEVFLSRREFITLPNLKTLTIHASQEACKLLRYAVMFLNDHLNVLSLTVTGESSDASEVETFLEEVTARTCNLRQMAFFSQVDSGRDMSDALDANDAGPDFTFTITEAKSDLDGDDDDDAEEPFRGVDLSKLETLSCGLEGNKNSFPSLLSLDIQTRIASATSFISAHSNFSQLRELNIDMVCHNDAKDLQKCLEVLSTTCKELERINFTRFLDNGDRQVVLSAESNLITKDTLAPIISFPLLINFSLTHTRPVVIPDDDLVYLLRRCRRLTKFHLNPYPLQTTLHTSPLPSLGVLHRIAQCRPELKHLGLYLDATVGDDSEFLCAPSVRTSSFVDLKTLSLGSSRIHDVNRAAVYLSHVLPFGCSLVCRNRFLCTEEEDWAEVSERLPLLLEAFSAQRSRIRELEEKVETLLSILKEPGLDAAGRDIIRAAEVDKRERSSDIRLWLKIPQSRRPSNSRLPSLGQQSPG